MKGPAAQHSSDSPFLLSPSGLRAIEVHPTRRCNLRCLHCYSESGPERLGDLPFDSLSDLLHDAATLGYRYVGVSGGEPLLWPDLERFLLTAIDTGYTTSIVTNGTLLHPSRARGLRGLARVVAVSVDGPPEEYAIMRRSATAFSAMERGLVALREADVKFVLLFTLTKFNAGRLRWLYEFAADVGAAGVQVHPLCGIGAAASNLREALPDGIEFRAASLLLALMRERQGPDGPEVFLDAIRRGVVERSTWPLLDPETLPGARFADLVPSIVVEADGTVVPFIYGFPRRWALGEIHGGDLPKRIETWRVRHALGIAEAVRHTLNRMNSAGEDYIDLFAEVLKTASEIASDEVAAGGG